MSYVSWNQQKFLATPDSIKIRLHKHYSNKNSSTPIFRNRCRDFFTELMSFKAMRVVYQAIIHYKAYNECAAIIRHRCHSLF